jgi:hypothetical protein
MVKLHDNQDRMLLAIAMLGAIGRQKGRDIIHASDLVKEGYIFESCGLLKLTDKGRQYVEEMP